jgi:hypothetical protein
LETKDVSTGRNRRRLIEMTCDVVRTKDTSGKLRVSPLNRGDCAAAIMVAASWGANLKLFGLCRLRFSAVMQRLAKAAGMRRRGRHCEDRRREISQQRENYEKLGNSPMHCLVSGSLPTYRCEKQYSVGSG